MFYINGVYMSLYSKYRTDPKIEVQGYKVELKDTPNDDGTFPTFYVGRMGGANKSFQEVHNKVWMPYREARQAGNVPDAIGEANNRIVFVDGVLKHWEYVPKEVKNGEKPQPLPFTRENALALFVDLPELLFDLQAKAADRDNFLKDQTKVAAGN